MTNEDQWQKIVKFTAYIICIIAIVFILKTLKGIFIPFFLAMFFVYLFAPIVEFLAKFKIPRILTLFLLLGIISLIGTFLAMIVIKNIKEFIDLWPTFEKTLLSSIGNFLKNYLQLDTSSLLELLRSLKIRELLSSLINFSFSFFGKLILTILMLIFLYLSYHNYPKIVQKAFNDGQADKIFNVVNNINEQIINYIYVKTVISAGTGIFTGVTCALLGIKFAVLWGFLAFLLNYIPYIGSFIAVILPVVFSIFQFSHFLIPLILFIALFVIQLFWGSFLDPEMMGNKFNLSPILIIVSLFFWGYVWGIVGAFLAVPITAIIKIILQNIDSLKFFAVLMSKRAD